MSLRQIFDLINWKRKYDYRPADKEGFARRFDGIISFHAAVRTLGNLPGDTKTWERALYYWKDQDGEHLLVTERAKQKRSGREDNDHRR